jgi:1-deoxy-D-xylulose-5-phosphate reductoisomerase
MGTKNTIDSATMMNKGLEVIEASRLFGLRADQVRIVVHPQSITHGFVLFSDGNVKSQIAAPDMRLPIGYALAYPQRLPQRNGTLDTLAALGAQASAPSLRYDFEPPDPQRFPCVALAYAALERGGTMPAVLSAANEVAVQAFVEERIAFGRIATVIEETMESTSSRELSLPAVRDADTMARVTAANVVERIERAPRG